MGCRSRPRLRSRQAGGRTQRQPEIVIPGTVRATAPSARQLTPSPPGAYHFRLAARVQTHLYGAAINRAMEKKKLDYFKKKLEERQQQLRRTVSRTEQDGRASDLDSAQDIADRAASSCRWWRARSAASARAHSASASPAARTSIPSVWKPFPGPATASSARKRSSRATTWKRPLASKSIENWKFVSGRCIPISNQRTRRYLQIT